MDGKMTMEQVRDLMADIEQGKAPLRQFEARDCREALDFHLAQPSQAVDVEKVREVIAYLKIGHRFDVDMADKLTCAIGNAQADGWMDIATAPRTGSRFMAYVPIKGHRIVVACISKDGLLLNEWLQPMPYPASHWQPLPTPPTKATPNAHE